MDENGPFIEDLWWFTYQKWWFAIATLYNQTKRQHEPEFISRWIVRIMRTIASFVYPKNKYEDLAIHV